MHVLAFIGSIEAGTDGSRIKAYYKLILFRLVYMRYIVFNATRARHLSFRREFQGFMRYIDHDR